MRLVFLGLPPSTNNLYAVVGGRQVISETGRLFHRAVAAVARRAQDSRPASIRPFAVLVTYHLGAYDRDVDGSHKAILDGFAPTARNGHRSPIIWLDDRQVVLFVARKRRVARGVLPYVSVVVRELKAMPVYADPSEPAGALVFSTSLYPPSTNNTYVVWAGRRRKSKLARAVTSAYADGFRGLVGQRPPATGNLRFRLRYGITADRRDVDGSHKLLFDAARGLLWLDDRQVTSFSVAKARRPREAEPVIAGAVWEVAEDRRPTRLAHP